MTKIIAFEGIDGTGKTVQMRRLSERLAARGLRVMTLSFPMYDSFFGAQVGRLLSGRDGVRADDVDGKSMALWFALDRFEAFRALDYSGADALLINRYVLSNAVYQSIRDIDIDKPDVVDWVFELEYEHFHLPKADLFLFYDVATAQAEKNVRQKGFRAYVGDGGDVYEESKGIQQRARDMYLKTAKRRNDIAVVPCMRDGVFQSAETIAAETMRIIKEKGLL